MSEPKRQIAFARPCLGDAEAAAAARSVRSGWVTQGPEVANFERQFAEYVEAGYACAVSSCTAALHLALRAVGVEPDDEVITVSHSYIATANAVRYCGATPVFVDIEPVTFNINPDLIEEAITERTRAILCVHQMGMPCDLEAILRIARRRDLRVIEDAACALGSEVFTNNHWNRIGAPHGHVACFSFHPRKPITTGDGGMLVTSNPEWDRRFRLWRHHGMDVCDLARHHADQVIFETYPTLGYNYRMTDIVAAVGRVQLQRLPEMLECRRRIGARYHELLASIPGLRPPDEPVWARTNFQSYCVWLPDGCDQRQVMQIMMDRGVATRRGVMCAHREPAYADLPPRHPLLESERAQDHTILLPMHPQLTDDDIAYVVETLDAACRHAAPCTTAG